MSSPLSPHGLAIPDLADAVIGYRAFAVPGELPRFGNKPKLYSVNARIPDGTERYFWKPREVQMAHCKSCPEEDRPRMGCGCGFYSALTISHLLDDMSYARYNGERDGMYCVLARVANWGNVVRGDLGWRAQYSYPVKLMVPYEIWTHLKPLKESYGVEAVIGNFLKPACAVVDAQGREF